MTIYTGNIGKTIVEHGREKWEKVILDDFKSLENAELPCPFPTTWGRLLWSPRYQDRKSEMKIGVFLGRSDRVNQLGIGGFRRRSHQMCVPIPAIQSSEAFPDNRPVFRLPRPATTVTSLSMQHKYLAAWVAPKTKDHHVAPRLSCSKIEKGDLRNRMRVRHFANSAILDILLRDFYCPAQFMRLPDLKKRRVSLPIPMLMHSRLLSVLAMVYKFSRKTDRRCTAYRPHQRNSCAYS